MLITLPRLVLAGEMAYRGEFAVDLARCRTLEFGDKVATLTSRHSEIVEIKREEASRRARAYARRHFIDAGSLWVNPAYIQQIRFGDAAGAVATFAGQAIPLKVDLAGIADAVRRTGLTEVYTGRFASLAQTLWYQPNIAEGIQNGLRYNVSPDRLEAVLDLIASDDWIVHGNGVLGNPSQIQILHDDLCYYDARRPMRVSGQTSRLEAISWFDLGDGIKINLDHVDFIEEPGYSGGKSDEVTLWLDNGVSMAMDREAAAIVLRASETAQVRLGDGLK